MTNNGFDCESVSAVHSWMFPARCNNSDAWTAGAKFCQKSCWEAGYGYPGDDCSTGDFRSEHACAYQNEKLTFPEAEARCASRGMKVCPVRTASDTCGYYENYLWTPEECDVSVVVHFDGRVSVDWDDMAKKAKFPVLWRNGFPAQDPSGACPAGCVPEGTSCSCAARAEARRAFDALPSAVQVRAGLKVGAFPPPPTTPCTAGCGGEVEAFSRSGVIDSETVFRSGGRFFKNVELTVHLPDHEFRNPPTFTLRHSPSSKKALDEVESLLDHLFFHENTPQFLAYRLIQRLTVSNPSPKYVRDVQAAFRSGSFNGTNYSGAYGDLAATTAAILLHPEARDGGVTSGSLREPLLKIVHFMRSMEYRDKVGREVQLRGMMDAIGQWPYSSVDVFNYFQPEFHPEGFADDLVGPEFQIFTMPNILNYINGMTSMMEYGASNCYGGLGWPVPGCAGGSFAFTEAGDKNQTIAEMDLLLTGGRLGEHATSVLAHEYDKAAAGSKLQALQYASLVTPAFHTLGDSLLPTSPAPLPAPAPARPARDYRAVVMLYLQGGVDSFQVLVPTYCQLYDEYRAVRESIALPPEQLLGIRTTGQACARFGIHSQLPFLGQLYNQGEAAFVSNIGPLVEPLTAKSFRENGRRCNGLFSHIDQERAAQTLTCQTATPIYKGAGGRLADALAEGPHAYRTESFSMSGRAKWSLGYQTVPKIIDRRSGNIPLTHPSKIVTVLDNVTSVRHSNVFCEEYRRQLKEALAVNEELGATLDAAALGTAYNAGDSSLSQQLRQVARLISARGPRQAERDLFFVQLGGFDHHQSVAPRLRDLLKEVDDALRLFVAELKAQGAFDQVLLVSHSDFGRTLAPNSNAGTDHGWAGNHFVLGGAVNGGKIYNKWPETLLPGHAMDVHHGRIIPEFPWENIMVPVAEWMGMEASQARGVFPNLENFNASKHILPRSAIFST